RHNTSSIARIPQGLRAASAVPGPLSGPPCPPSMPHFRSRHPPDGPETPRALNEYGNKQVKTALSYFQSSFSVLLRRRGLGKLHETIVQRAGQEKPHEPGVVVQPARCGNGNP